MTKWEVTAYRVESDEFNGIVYDVSIALDMFRDNTNVFIQNIKLYRDHEPLPHMTYRKIEE